MTTRVTIDAHAGWDIKVVYTTPAREGVREHIVKGGTEESFYIHEGQNIILIEEIKKG